MEALAMQGHKAKLTQASRKSQFWESGKRKKSKCDNLASLICCILLIDLNLSFLYLVNNDVLYPYLFQVLNL